MIDVLPFTNSRMLLSSHSDHIYTGKKGKRLTVRTLILNPLTEAPRTVDLSLAVYRRPPIQEIPCFYGVMAINCINPIEILPVLTAFHEVGYNTKEVITEQLTWYEVQAPPVFCSFPNLFIDLGNNVISRETIRERKSPIVFIGLDKGPEVFPSRWIVTILPEMNGKCQALIFGTYLDSVGQGKLRKEGGFLNYIPLLTNDVSIELSMVCDIQKDIIQQCTQNSTIS